MNPNPSELRIINVAPLFENDKETEILYIQNKLNLKRDNQIIYIDNTAKDFMTNTMNKEFFESNFGEPDGVPFE